MPSKAALLAEALRAQQTAQVALAVIGAKAYAEVVVLWEEVALASGRATASAISRFVAQASRVVAVRRAQAVQVTVAHERLQRALKVGQPLELPDALDLGRPKETLSDLRTDFVQTVRDLAPGALRSGGLTDAELELGDLKSVEERPTPKGLPVMKYEPYRPPASSPDAAKQLKAERLAGLERELADIERRWEKVARQSLAASATDSAARARAAGTPEKVADTHATGGRKVGAVAASSVRGAGHEVGLATASRDRQVVGYVRVHTSFDGNGPCSFCAMMLSRGVVYKSKETAGGGIGSRYQYHPNCKCKGEAVYRGEDFESDPRFEMNRFYQKRWNRVVKNQGLKGGSALRAWRRHIEAFNRGQVP